MSTSTEIRFAQQGAVGHLQLTRPEKKNAQSFQMWQELRELGQRLLADPSGLAVLMVSGTGGVFSSGIDTSLFTSPEFLSGAVDGQSAQAAFSWLREAPFITIAAIERYAIGAGLELALWCDLRLATEGTYLSLPEIDYGIIPDLGGCALLPEICGYGRALELITTARKIDAAEAHRWGLLNEVVATDRWLTRLEELTTLLAKRSTTALRGCKRAARLAIPSPSASLTISLQSIHECLMERSAQVRK